MNKRIVFGTALATLAWALNACSAGGIRGSWGSGGGEAQSKSYDGYQTEGFSKYSSIGYGSVFEGDEADGFAKAHDVRAMNYDYSASGSPFYLVGQTSAGAEKLTLTNGSLSENVKIRQCADLGDFISFIPEEGMASLYYESGSLVYEAFELRSAPDAFDSDYTSFISKKTGKVYKPTASDIEGFSIRSIEYGGGVTYVLLNGGYNIDVLYSLKEENGALKLSPTKISRELLPNFNTIQIDKFGNLLTNNGIVTPDIRNHRFESYFPDDEGRYMMNPKTKQIVHFSEDKSHCYVLEQDGAFHESESALDGFVSEYYETFGGEEFCESFRNDSGTIYVGMDGEMGYSVSGRNIMDENGEYNLLYENEGDVCYGINYNGGSYFGIYEFTALENGVLLKEQTNIFGERVYDDLERVSRGSNIYWCDSSNLYKFDMESQTTTKMELDLGDYSITGLSVDRYGYIKLSLVDDYFNSMEAYLEMDETVSFEKKTAPKEKDCVLYPLSGY